MYERDYQIGREAFYKMVGGPDAMIPKNDGASVILRLLAIQLREACCVPPYRFDSGTRGIFKSVDSFYDLKRVRQYPTTFKPEEEAHSARQFFRTSGIPQDALTEIHKEVSVNVAAFEHNGVLGKLRAGVVRERTAALISRKVVAKKTKIIFSFSSGTS